MRQLKESLLSNVKAKATDNSVIIEDWIRDNYIIKGEMTINSGKVNVYGSITKKTVDGPLTNGFEFMYVDGNFVVDNCNITDLTGSPRVVQRDFCCSKCPNLTSLKGSPKSVGSFRCRSCYKLTSLEGGPRHVYNEYVCMSCKNLRNLKGAPHKVTRFNCEGCDRLTTLEGAPKSVEGEFNCSACIKLTSLKYAPDDAEKYNCTFCRNLKDYAGIESEKIIK